MFVYKVNILKEKQDEFREHSSTNAERNPRVLHTEYYFQRRGVRIGYVRRTNLRQNHGGGRYTLPFAYKVAKGRVGRL